MTKVATTELKQRIDIEPKVETFEVSTRVIFTPSGVPNEQMDKPADIIKLIWSPMDPRFLPKK